MSRETLTALAIVALVFGGGIAGYSLWTASEAREEEAAREARREAREAEESEARAELREESAGVMPEMLEGVALGETVEEVRSARPRGAVAPSTSRSDPELMLLEEHLPNGAEVMYGFNRGDGRLAQVQFLLHSPGMGRRDGESSLSLAAAEFVVEGN